jgi:hypothetical protein
MNTHKLNALCLSSSQIKLLEQLTSKTLTENMPYRNADDADRLFDLHYLVCIGFVEVKTASAGLILCKLIFNISLAGRYAWSVIQNVQQAA